MLYTEGDLLVKTDHYHLHVIRRQQHVRWGEETHPDRRADHDAVAQHGPPQHRGPLINVGYTEWNVDQMVGS